MNNAFKCTKPSANFTNFTDSTNTPLIKREVGDMHVLVVGFLMGGGGKVQHILM